MQWQNVADSNDRKNTVILNTLWMQSLLFLYYNADTEAQKLTQLLKKNQGKWNICSLNKYSFRWLKEPSLLWV